MKVGCDDGRVMPGHVVPTNVVSEDDYYIRLLLLPDSQLGKTAESDAEIFHGSKDQGRLVSPRK